MEENNPFDAGSGSDQGNSPHGGGDSFVSEGDGKPPPVTPPPPPPPSLQATLEIVGDCTLDLKPLNPKPYQP
jgi:hypothetical protein